MTASLPRTGTRSRTAAALLLSAGIAAGVLAVPVAAVAQPAASVAPAKAAAAPLVGTWIGTYQGYYDGMYVSGQQKYVVSKAKGYVAKGTWQFRESSSKPWSAAKPVQLSVLPETDESNLDVYGADTAGTYAGELDGDRLALTYNEAGAKPQTLVFQLRRK